MPFKFHHILFAALAMIMACALLAAPTFAKGLKQKGIIILKGFDLPPLVISEAFPGTTALQRMQISLDTYRRVQLEEMKEAGAVIKFGRIAVTSQPEDAEVLISSFVGLGRTPFTKTELLTGAHRVTVRKQGFYEQVRMVEVIADKTSQVAFKLKPIPYARLTINTVPRDAKIKIIGVHESYEPEMLLTPGEYLVRISHQKYGEHRLWAVLGANQNSTLTADLADKTGKIKVVAKQEGATVYLDGQEAGSAPLTIAGLMPGPHKLQVWKSLYKPTTRMVRVRSAATANEKIDLAAVKHFTNSLRMEFVEIPAGSFMMGHRDLPETEVLKARNPKLPSMDAFTLGLPEEYPRHLVKISKPFYIQTTEVTWAQWYAIMDEDISPDELFVGDNLYPVMITSFKEVQEFLAKLNQRDKGKYHYQLPTEAQWEYAARAGTTSPFFTGESVSAKQANINGTWFYNGRADGLYREMECKGKTFPPNPWGLFDTIGNSYELCADGYDCFFYPRSPIVDPRRGETKNRMYVLRSGYLDRGPSRCTAASRSMIETAGPSADSVNFSVRLVATKLNGEK